MLLKATYCWTVFLCACAVSSALSDSTNGDCPRSCYCTDDGLLVDCSGRGLSRLPPHLPTLVRKLNLAGNQLHQLDAAHLSRLTELRELDVSNNAISSLPPELFASSSRIRVLDLSGNRLDVVPSRTLSRLSGLRELYLADNDIVAIAAADFNNLVNLTVLDLSRNGIEELGSYFIDHLPRLLDLRLAHNQLRLVDIGNFSRTSHGGLERLDLSFNVITSFTSKSVMFPNLHMLNLTANRLMTIDALWFVNLPSLNHVQLDFNHIHSIEDGVFLNAANVIRLWLSHLPNFTHVGRESFNGLTSLEELDLSSNQNLVSLDHDTFSNLNNLRVLDLGNNALVTLWPKNIKNLTKLESIRMSGNQWYCGCRMKAFRSALLSLHPGLGEDIVCASPPSVQNEPLLNVSFSHLQCVQRNGIDIDLVLYAPIGSSVILDCPVNVGRYPALTWSSTHGRIISRTVTEINSMPRHLRVVFQYGNDSLAHTVINITHHRHMINWTLTDQLKLLPNGSLQIDMMSRMTTGRYRCLVSGPHENHTMVIELRLDYSIMSFVMLSSLVVGGGSALAFFSIAVVLGAVRYCAHVCSAEERAKRKSLRELLNQMRNSSQFDRWSAYRTAKMDQLSAFKSATMDQLSAFTSARIGRLRKYKQATVSGVLHQLERLREHYMAQTARIKDSYANSVERLRHNYAQQRGRLHDRRSIGVQRMRDQYNARAVRAREYSMAQVARLREQYKQQQQYLLKLLELIDVGSCVSSAVEAECMRAESAIFDAGIIMFDEEARPSHAIRTDDPIFPIPDVRKRRSSSISLSQSEGIGDMGSAGFPLMQRSLSTSDMMDGGHDMVNLTKPDVLEDVVVHATWHKSLSTPVVCVVHHSERKANVSDELVIEHEHEV